MAIFTNLTQDHLDYHKTMENYKAAKGMLFARAAKSVINMDDAAGAYMKEQSKGEVLTIGVDSKADLVAQNYLKGDVSPEEHVSQKDIEKAVRKVVEDIPKKYRDVVVLRVYAELPFSQVAQILRISENSAKVIYFRAKKMLMEVLKDELEM